MKNKLLIILLCFSIFLVACSNENTNTVVEPTINTATLHAGTLPEDMNTYEFEYSGELTPQVLAEGLSSLTGLDFIISSTEKTESLYIDWNSKSTLIASLDDREQKEDFYFSDTDSMRWFMMDSLLTTLKENLTINDIYYTMDGGKELEFEELYPTNIIPSDFPFEGSAFFFAHANNTGDMDDQDGRGDLIENEDMSDPGDTNQNEWWGVYVSNDLGFSIEITEFTGTNFWFDIYLLRNGSQVLSGTAVISEDDDHLATMDEIGLYLYEDFSAIDFQASESSVWEHMRGQYIKLED